MQKYTEHSLLHELLAALSKVTHVNVVHQKNYIGHTRMTPFAASVAFFSLLISVTVSSGSCMSDVYKSSYLYCNCAWVYANLFSP